ncbi:MAG: Na+/H+ antiporter subunit E [Pseudomonadota bacterium]
MGWILKPLWIVLLIVTFLYELVVSAVRVFVEVMTPGLGATPRFVAMPLDAKTDLGITMTGNLITLTPGTLTVDVSPDKGHLMVHAMYSEDGAEAVIEGMKGSLEKAVVRALE